jgi:hypothetical protein
MVRERVGDRRFAMACLVPIFLVIALVQTGTNDPTFAAGQDRLSGP